MKRSLQCSVGKPWRVHQVFFDRDSHCGWRRVIESVEASRHSLSCGEFGRPCRLASRIKTLASAHGLLADAHFA
jgi:hypothetical protein